MLLNCSRNQIIFDVCTRSSNPLGWVLWHISLHMSTESFSLHTFCRSTCRVLFGCYILMMIISHPIIPGTFMRWSLFNQKKKPESADENEEKKKKVANILCPIFAINLHRFSPQITLQGFRIPLQWHGIRGNASLSSSSKPCHLHFAFGRIPIFTTPRSP